MIALDLAVKAIKEGQIESAIVGGSNLLLSPSSKLNVPHSTCSLHHPLTGARYVCDDPTRFIEPRRFLQDI